MNDLKSICKLCLEKEADQKNSHIIPKFLGKNLFAESKPRHSLLFTSVGEQRKVQDTPKEDHLICQNCERGFNLYETICSFRLKRFDDIKYRISNHFKYLKTGAYDCFNPVDLDIKIFNLFIYSIVWRASVSESDVFKNFKLSCDSEDQLRKFLKKYSSGNQIDLVVKLNSCKDLPPHVHFIFRPDKKLRTPNSGLFLKTIDENFHHLGLVDYALFYYTDRNVVFPSFEYFNNNRLEGDVIIGLLPENVWRDINFDIIRTLLNRY